MKQNMVNRKWFKVAVKGILLFYLFTFSNSGSA